MGGDVNHHPFGNGIDLYSDMKILDSPPTRLEARLDQVAVNFQEEIVEITTLPPLSSEDEIPVMESDHLVLSVTAGLKHKHHFRPISYMKRKINEHNKELFRHDFCSVDWEKEIGSITCPNQMTSILHGVINKMNDHCFPWVKVKKKSTDPSWITDPVRAVIRRRKICYKKKKQNHRWRILKSRSEDMIRSTRKNTSKEKLRN